MNAQNKSPLPLGEGQSEERNLLTAHMPLLASAPNGIKKLRELILELAVRGALLPQDPGDEPASDLLKQITEEKMQLVAKRKTSERISLVAIDEAAAPYKAASGWLWIKLGDISLIERGGSPRPIKDFLTEDADGLNWIKIGDTDKGGKYITSAGEKIRREGLTKTRLVYPGDFLLTNSMSFGRPYITQIEGCIHDGWLRISPPASLVKDYLYLLLSSPYVRSFFVQAAAGAVVLNLNADKVRELPIPLPPLAEQHRIVAKVDELMALCDRLEAQQAGAESAHAQLVQALLDSLTQASDAANFATSWQRLAEHFHTLFTTESSIDALKQTLLQLAVMGKLVPQDSSDEPASELLKRIQIEKQQLVAEGKLKKQKPLADLTDTELPFSIPAKWAWSRIGELALSTEYGLSEKTSDLPDGVPVLKMGDIQGGQILLGGQMKVSKATEGLPELYLEPEDLLYNRTNSAELVGKTGLFLGNTNEFTFASYLIRIRCLKKMLSPAYLNISMNTPVFRDTQINPHLKQQCGQANVNGTIMKSMLISVPPVTEQHRIVAKVDQLMTLCDQLKNRLTQARQLNEQLASALVEQAVA